MTELEQLEALRSIHKVTANALAKEAVKQAVQHIARAGIKPNYPPNHPLAEHDLGSVYDYSGHAEKLQLPTNIISIIDEVVNDIAQLRTAFDDVAAHQYSKAVQDLLQVVEHIVVDLILPKVKAKAS